MTTITDPIPWRERRGAAPYEVRNNALAAGAAHVLAVAADRAWEEGRTAVQVIQVPFRQDVAIGQTLVARLADGKSFAGRIAAIEQIIDPPLAITRLEIEVAQ